jgi:ABC-type Zn uptake system ZnuABC Zn-binding protein ZnuA
MKNNLKTIVLLILFSLTTACAPPAPAAGESRLQVDATTSILTDVVTQVGGEHINVITLIPEDIDPHSFEPTPQDRAALENADLIFSNGLDLEEFLERLADDAIHQKLITVSDQVQPLQGQGEHPLDPHVWMDPANVVVWVHAIQASLSQLDPANAAGYQANAAAYTAELDQLDQWLMDTLSPIPLENRLLVTDHEALAYFAAAYDFKIIGALIPSTSTLSEPSAGELAVLQDLILSSGAPAIFIGASANPALADQIAGDLGLQVVILYAESFNPDHAPTYIEMMRYNGSAILEALK